MKKLFLLYTLICALIPIASAQTPNGGYSSPATSSGSGIPAGGGTLIAAPVQSGLIGQYQMLPTETCGALADTSGSGNNATGTIGTAPTIIANSGGCNFTGNGAIKLPAALNSALTIQVFVNHQATGDGNTFSCPVSGNGNLTTSNAVQICLTNSNTNTSQMTGGYRAWIYDNNAIGLQQWSVLNGNAALSATFGTGSGVNSDNLYINDLDTLECCNMSFNQGHSNGVQTVGFYQLGGAAAGSGNTNQTYFTGNMYYALFYNRVLTSSEVKQNVQFMQNVVAARNVPTYLYATDGTNECMFLGDSLESGTPIPVNMTFATACTVDVNAVGGMQLCSLPPNNGISGCQPKQAVPALPQGWDMGKVVVDPLYRPRAAQNIVVIYLGTNDASETAPVVYGLMKSACLARRAVGWKCVPVSIQSQTSGDAYKDALGPLYRQTWSQWADGFIDMASDPNIGADGASTNTTYFSDGVHYTTHADYNDGVAMWNRVLNKIYACNDFSCANNYTTAATAVTITAATESTNTMTFTSASGAPAKGQCVVVAGVTPAGYNSAANSCWLVLTSNGSTSWTAWNNTTGLGAGTVFGTFTVPTLLDVDKFATFGNPAANIAPILESCQGYTGQQIHLLSKNTSGNTITITPQYSSETIGGAATLVLANGASKVLQARLVSAAAAGCTWDLVQ